MPMLSFLLACTILWAQVYTTSNCQAIMNIHLIVKNRCIGGYSAIINLNHKFIITFRTDVDFNINILKTKFPNSFWISIFLQNNFIPNPRQISKFEPDVFMSVHFSKLSQVQINFGTDDMAFVLLFFFSKQI